MMTKVRIIYPDVKIEYAVRENRKTQVAEFQELKVGEELTIDDFINQISDEAQKLDDLQKIFWNDSDLNFVCEELRAQYFGLCISKKADYARIQKLQNTANKIVKHHAQAYKHFIHSEKTKDINRAQRFFNFLQVRKDYHLKTVETQKQELKELEIPSCSLDEFIGKIPEELDKLDYLENTLGTRFQFTYKDNIKDPKKQFLFRLFALKDKYEELQKTEEIKDEELAELISLQKKMNKYLRAMTNKIYDKLGIAKEVSTDPIIKQELNIIHEKETDQVTHEQLFAYTRKYPEFYLTQIE